VAAYFLHLAILAGIFIIVAVSLNLIIGFAGQVSLGHAAFYGIGAYVSALTAIHLHFPFPLAALAAVAGAGLCGLALGMPTLRLKEDYLAIVTLGFGVIVDQVFLNLNITGGPDGLTGIPCPSFLGWSFRNPVLYLILVLLMVGLTLGLIWRLVQSQHGRALRAIRDHEVTAQVMGINTKAYKIGVFSLAAALTGLAGSLYAHYISFISPESFGLHTSILVLCMVVLGGMGSLAGSVVGAVALVLLPEGLRYLQPFFDFVFGHLGLLGRKVEVFQELIYGGLLIALLIWRPGGLMGKGKTSLKFVERKR
jgi:branched-chain amino acid transport system permease protein